ncbi:hypothetical protein EDD86DRAFT_246970 [Gorgonomyces haynaldii]|nr:hypothetical protein EDD86DRAFT_246970 [Gorgonomyces haynaldii]
MSNLFEQTDHILQQALQQKVIAAIITDSNGCIIHSCSPSQTLLEPAFTASFLLANDTASKLLGQNRLMVSRYQKSDIVQFNFALTLTLIAEKGADLQHIIDIGDQLEAFILELSKVLSSHSNQLTLSAFPEQ